MCMYTDCFILVVSLFFHVFKVKLAHQWVCITNLEKSLLIMPAKFKEQIHWVTEESNQLVFCNKIYITNTSKIITNILLHIAMWQCHCFIPVKDESHTKIELLKYSFSESPSGSMQVQLVSCVLRKKRSKWPIKAGMSPLNGQFLAGIKLQMWKSWL